MLFTCRVNLTETSVRILVYFSIWNFGMFVVLLCFVSFCFALFCCFFFHNSYYLYCSMNDDRRWQPMLAYSANHISCLWLLNQKTNLSARNSIVKLINWSEPTWIDIPRSLSCNTRCGKEGNTTRNKQPPLPTFWWSVSWLEPGWTQVCQPPLW